MNYSGPIDTYIRATLIIICFTLIHYTGVSQDYPALKDSAGIYHIDWKGWFPDGKEEKGGAAISRRITGLLLGKKPPVICKPVSVTARDTNSYWVLDQGNGTVFQVVKGQSKAAFRAQKDSAGCSSLVDVCQFKDGELLFTDSRLNKIFRLSPDTKKMEVLNDKLKLERPTGIAYSQFTKEIYVVETNADRISVLNENGELLRTIGNSGKTPGGFNRPATIHTDKHGNVYIVDSMNFRVQVFDKEGNVISVFGKQGDSGGDFARPKGIAVDSQGNIYVADALFHVIQIFDKKGNFLYVFGKQGREKGEFWMPSGIFIDGNDFIYVADTYNSRIQIFHLEPGAE